MAKQEEGKQQQSFVSDENKGKIKEGLQGAAGDIKREVREKAVEVIEEAIVKLEEILAKIKPVVTPVVQDAGLHIQSAIDKLKKSKEGNQ